MLIRLSWNEVLDAIIMMFFATIVDTTDNLYHLNLSQDSRFESPEESYGAAEITAAINEFPEEYRVPFSMHVAGYKYNEIAEHMNLPLGTVKSRIFFARKKLQERFVGEREYFLCFYCCILGFGCCSRRVASFRSAPRLARRGTTYPYCA